ncbi:MAG TPA: hypothetical protein DDY68_00505 [Porphyromonadaceae bacterium]|nr:hypothetical protein [Porphyromonadaceae bacterium]
MRTYPHRIAKIMSWFIPSRKNRHHFLEKHDRREIERERLEKERILQEFDANALIDVETLNRLNLRFIPITTTPHTRFIAELILKKLNDVGISGAIFYEVPIEKHYEKMIHIVICPQCFEKMPKYYFAFQMEQTISNRWIDEAYIDKLKKSVAVLDYSLQNIRYWYNMGFQYKQLFYLPVFSKCKEKIRNDIDPYKYDILFYGDPSSQRRKHILDVLSSKFNVKIVCEVYKEEMTQIIKESKIILNIHFYENSLLESTRIAECLSLGKVIVSEKGIDQAEYQYLDGIVDFVEEGNTDELVSKLSYLLECTNFQEEEKRRMDKLSSCFDKFSFCFYRVLLAHNIIDYDKFYNVIGKKFPLEKDFVCLSLPETIERRDKWLTKEGAKGAIIFDGLRHFNGVIGCALSYKFLINRAKDLGLENITICEDDVVFDKNHSKRLQEIREWLSIHNDWDIFAGLIADFNPNTKVLYVEKYKGEII